MVRLKYKIDNENFFNVIDSESKAYFLGLLISDGCINDNNRINISLQKDDTYILEKFLLELGYNGVLYTLNPKNPKHKIQRKFSLRSDIMYDDLLKYGFIENKSLTIKFPEGLKDNFYVIHFIRGIFDGDGHISLKKNNTTCLKITGTKELLSGIEDIFIKELGIPKGGWYQANKLKNTYERTYNKREYIFKIYEFLYKDSNDDLRLLRKYNFLTNLIKVTLNKYSEWILKIVHT